MCMIVNSALALLQTRAAQYSRPPVLVANTHDPRYTKASSWGPPRTPLTNVTQSNPLLGTRPRKVCPADACTTDGPKGAGPPWAIFCCFYHATGGTVEDFTTGNFWGTRPGPPGGECVVCLVHHIARFGVCVCVCVCVCVWVGGGSCAPHCFVW
jgi:hypothetical protein